MGRAGAFAFALPLRHLWLIAIRLRAETTDTAASYSIFPANMKLHHRTSWLYRRTMSAVVGQADELQRALMMFVRGFGLHDPERTPCGQPMSVSEAHALTELAERPTMRQRELGRRLHLQKSTVSRLVGQLAARGWVQRAAAVDDGRGVSIALTACGANVATQVQAARRVRCESLLAGIPPSQRANVLAALRVLTEAVNVQDSRG